MRAAAGLIGYCLYINGVKYEIAEVMEWFASFFCVGGYRNIEAL